MKEWRKNKEMIQKTSFLTFQHVSTMDQGLLPVVDSGGAISATDHGTRTWKHSQLHAFRTFVLLENWNFVKRQHFDLNDLKLNRLYKLCMYLYIYIYTHYFMHWKFKIIANLFSQIWFQLIFISESKLHCSQVGSPCIKPETRVRNVPKVLWLQISYRSLQRQENHGIGKHITLGSHEKHEALRLCGYPWNLDRLTIWHPSDIRLTLPGVSSNRSGSRGGDRNKSRHQHLQPRWPFENYECAGNWKRFCGKRGKCGDWKPIFRKT